MTRPNLVEFREREFNKSFVKRLFETLENIYKGRTRNTGTVTLTQSAASTVVQDPLFESSQAVMFSPLTATAAAEAGSMYVSSKGAGTFTITHSNTADADKTFDYLIVG